MASLQGFEPAGLFARDLAECLKIQLIENDQFTPLFGQLLNNLEQLGREIKQLAQMIQRILLGCYQLFERSILIGENLGIEFREMPSPDVIVTRKKGLVGRAESINSSSCFG